MTAFRSAAVFKTIAHDLQISERILKDRDETPAATILDGQAHQSTPKSGRRAGLDGAKRMTGFKGLHGSRYVAEPAAVDDHIS